MKSFYWGLMSMEQEETHLHVKVSEWVVS